MQKIFKELAVEAPEFLKPSSNRSQLDEFKLSDSLWASLFRTIRVDDFLVREKKLIALIETSTHPHPIAIAHGMLYLFKQSTLDKKTAAVLFQLGAYLPDHDSISLLAKLLEQATWYQQDIETLLEKDTFLLITDIFNQQRILQPLKVLFDTGAVKKENFDRLFHLAKERRKLTDHVETLTEEETNALLDELSAYNSLQEAKDLFSIENSHLSPVLVEVDEDDTDSEGRPTIKTMPVIPESSSALLIEEEDDASSCGTVFSAESEDENENTIEEPDEEIDITDRFFEALAERKKTIEAYDVSDETGKEEEPTSQPACSIEEPEEEEEEDANLKQITEELKAMSKWPNIKELILELLEKKKSPQDSFFFLAYLMKTWREALPSSLSSKFFTIIEAVFNHALNNEKIFTAITHLKNQEVLNKKIISQLFHRLFTKEIILLLTKDLQFEELSEVLSTLMSRNILDQNFEKKFYHLHYHQIINNKEDDVTLIDICFNRHSPFEMINALYDEKLITEDERNRAYFQSMQCLLLETEEEIDIGEEPKSDRLIKEEEFYRNLAATLFEIKVNANFIRHRVIDKILDKLRVRYHTDDFIPHCNKVIAFYAQNDMNLISKFKQCGIAIRRHITPLFSQENLYHSIQTLLQRNLIDSNQLNAQLRRMARQRLDLFAEYILDKDLAATFDLLCERRLVSEREVNQVLLDGKVALFHLIPIENIFPTIEELIKIACLDGNKLSSDLFGTYEAIKSLVEASTPTMLINLLCRLSHPFLVLDWLKKQKIAAVIKDNLSNLMVMTLLDEHTHEHALLARDYQTDEHNALMAFDSRAKENRLEKTYEEITQDSVAILEKSLLSADVLPMMELLLENEIMDDDEIYRNFPKEKLKSVFMNRLKILGLVDEMRFILYHFMSNNRQAGAEFEQLDKESLLPFLNESTFFESAEKLLGLTSFKKEVKEKIEEEDVVELVDYHVKRKSVRKIISSAIYNSVLLESDLDCMLTKPYIRDALLTWIKESEVMNSLAFLLDHNKEERFFPDHFWSNVLITSEKVREQILNNQIRKFNIINLITKLSRDDDIPYDESSVKNSLPEPHYDALVDLILYREKMMLAVLLFTRGIDRENPLFYPFNQHPFITAIFNDILVNCRLIDILYTILVNNKISEELFVFFFQKEEFKEALFSSLKEANAHDRIIHFLKYTVTAWNEEPLSSCLADREAVTALAIKSNEKSLDPELEALFENSKALLLKLIVRKDLREAVLKTAIHFEKEFSLAMTLLEYGLIDFDGLRITDQKFLDEAHYAGIIKRLIKEKLFSKEEMKKILEIVALQARLSQYPQGPYLIASIKTIAKKRLRLDNEIIDEDYIYNSLFDLEESLVTCLKESNINGALKLIFDEISCNEYESQQRQIAFHEETRGVNNKQAVFMLDCLFDLVKSRNLNKDNIAQAIHNEEKHKGKAEKTFFPAREESSQILAKAHILEEIYRNFLLLCTHIYVAEESIFLIHLAETIAIIYQEFPAAARENSMITLSNFYHKHPNFKAILKGIFYFKNNHCLNPTILNFFLTITKDLHDGQAIFLASDYLLTLHFFYGEELIYRTGLINQICEATKNEKFLNALHILRKENFLTETNQTSLNLSYSTNSHSENAFTHELVQSGHIIKMTKLFISKNIFNQTDISRIFHNRLVSILRGSFNRFTGAQQIKILLSHGMNSIHYNHENNNVLELLEIFSKRGFFQTLIYLFSIRKIDSTKLLEKINSSPIEKDTESLKGSLWQSKIMDAILSQSRDQSWENSVRTSMNQAALHEDALYVLFSSERCYKAFYDFHKNKHQMYQAFSFFSILSRYKLGHVLLDSDKTAINIDPLNLFNLIKELLGHDLLNEESCHAEFSVLKLNMALNATGRGPVVELIDILSPRAANQANFWNILVTHQAFLLQCQNPSDLLNFLCWAAHISLDPFEEETFTELLSCKQSAKVLQTLRSLLIEDKFNKDNLIPLFSSLPSLGILRRAAGQQTIRMASASTSSFFDSPTFSSNIPETLQDVKY